MTKYDEYRKALRKLKRWDAYLERESGLPGPRANLELAQAVADEGDEALFTRYASLDAGAAPVNDPKQFLAVCGIVGLGRLLAEGRDDLWPELRRHAADPRWRTREAVAMALQRLGDRDMDALLRAMEDWSRGGLLEQRAAVAALCEPRLLREPAQAGRVLRILDLITASIAHVADRKSAEFDALRKTLGYGWSVAVVALPDMGRPIFERWLRSGDADVLWIMKENLKKNRLVRMDPAWVEACQARIERKR